MSVYLAIAFGGALGAVSRYWLISWVESIGTMRFPWGTIVVNVLGSFLIGILFVVITEKSLLGPEWRNILIVGYLGAFTTFSAFSMDAVLLLQDGFVVQALTYVLISVLICILVAWLGIISTRAIW